jgi:2-methylisocitrate lyase-like PEP mutase family enzyme
MPTQAEKAARFLELHHAPKLLVLPNIWDPLGARLLQGLGFPAVATASASVAFSLGHDDGERIAFTTMCDVIARIAASVDVPVSADIERGYATTPEAIAANMQRVLVAGAVGINLEDSIVEGGALQPIAAQCRTIRAVRNVADAAGVHLVINARTDVFLERSRAKPKQRLQAPIERAQAYLEAGADCIYPVGLADLDGLVRLQRETGAPINVYASANAPSIADLEAAGIARLSLGPGLLRACVTTMKRVCEDLQRGGNYDSVTRDAMTSDDIRRFLLPGPPPG